MQKYLVEFLGTMFLMYVILATGNAYAISAALAVAIVLGGKISGGHFNPAVSVAMTVKNKLSKNDLVAYVLAQMAGAVVALQLSR